MASKPVLILGGNGMLGQDLSKIFLDEKPVVWDRNDLDIANKDDVQKKLTRLQPSVVINAAAYNLVDAAESDEGFRIAMMVNSTGPIYLSTVCRDMNVTLVHYSTDYVFEGKNPGGYREDDIPQPQSRYAQSKAAGEHAVLHSGARAYIIRTCRLFGRLGLSKGSKQSFVDLMLNLAQKRDTIDVVDEEVASPTYSVDLAQETRRILDDERNPGIYHVTNSGTCTWYEFAKEIFRQKGISVNVRPVSAAAFPRPAPRPKYSVLINTKLPQLRPWQDALRAYLSERAHS